MIEIQIILYWQVIGAVAAALLISSWAFNLWITAHEERHGYTSGQTARLVVIGVLMTLGGIALVSWPAALIAFCGFICTGPFMIFGEHDRELARLRRRTEQRERDEHDRLEHERAALLEKTRE